MDKQREYFIGCVLQGLAANSAIYEQFQNFELSDEIPQHMKDKRWKEALVYRAIAIADSLIKEIQSKEEQRSSDNENLF